MYSLEVMQRIKEIRRIQGPPDQPPDRQTSVAHPGRNRPCAERWAGPVRGFWIVSPKRVGTTNLLILKRLAMNVRPSYYSKGLRSIVEGSTTYYLWLALADLLPFICM